MQVVSTAVAAGLVNEEFHSDLDGLYLRNHRDQTMAKVTALREKYGERRLGKATVWDRLMSLREINDESDADLEGMSQLGHALQTANSIVDAGHDLHLFSEEDLRFREACMKPFARHDLYTKNPHQVLEARLPEYKALIERRFPDPIEW